MNTQQKIARLEDLLARIQNHAAEPRSAVQVAPVMVAHAPAVVASPPAPSLPLVMLEAAEVMTPSLDPITTPPPSNPDYDSDSDVEVSSEVVEVDIDVDEPMLAAESGVNELIEVRDEEDEELAPNTQSSTDPPMALDVEEEVRAATPANEIEEPSPSSSRRPIASDHPAETYDDDSAPRHTPPPESGKQVTPSIAPQPSAPPPSLEGHTLIGGWREPGAGGAPNIVTGVTGVRVPAPAPVAAAPLSAEVSKPALPATAHVASIEGTPPAFKPSSFGDLLDASLGL